jgi:chaperone BCS1
MSISQLIILASAGGFGMSILYSLKALPQKLWRRFRARLIHTVTIYDYDSLYDMFEEWLYNHYRNSYRDVEAFYKSDKLLFQKGPSQLIVTWQGKRIFITKSEDKLDKATSIKEALYHRFKLHGFKAKDAIRNLLESIIAEYLLARVDNRVAVYMNNTWEWRKLGETDNKIFDNIALPGNSMESLKNDLNTFIANKSWYTKRGIPYKRGYLFYGPPGNGKTSLAFAIASFTKRRVYTLSLGSLEGSSVVQLISSMDEKAVLLIEDIDVVYNGRTATGTKVDFAVLLNILNGALTKTGTITVITTNHIEKLDPALIRDGRIDF